MFRESLRFASRNAVFSTLLAMVLSASAFASQPPATGLGQAWPNATDVSVSPHYHVYIFVRDGIRYIQVNDLNGTVRGAIAVADHVVLVLPVGVDASSVVTSASQTNTQVPSVSTGETVYHDSSIQIDATPQSTGAVQLLVTPMDSSNTCTAFNCTGGSVTASPVH
ncbi:hypothetical protein [Dyella psychrodurans]|uniref:hypothetical protein n=1 Tax=Dyella psychrodurans TaxID=1927960 RepID=UPI0011C06AE1|nr:hypothetical protein [Dyella psychrodurans]